MEYLFAFVPSLGVGLVFYLVMRWLFRSDRAERAAQADAQRDAEQWYEQVRNREGENAPFGYQEDSHRKQRGLGLRSSIPIRDTPHGD